MSLSRDSNLADDREQRARIVGDWPQTESRFLVFMSALAHSA